MPDKSDKSIPFVITDRRKFTTDGEARPDADPSPERHRPEAVAAPAPPPPAGETPGAPSQTASPSEVGSQDSDLPPAPTAEQMEQSRLAFNATAERLELAVRAANPGADHMPPMSFEQIVQSVYMQAILQLGGGTQQGEQPQVDILGARQSIDMLTILGEKSRGNLNPTEELLLNSAIFELRLGFLEITQALARSAQQRATAAGAPPPPGGPRIVR